MKYVAMLAVLLIVPLGSACTGGGDISTAEAVVRSQLKDPDSAQFKNTMIVGHITCGQVNARNAFGGYTGFQYFAYKKGTRRAGIFPMDSSGDVDVASLCHRLESLGDNWP